MPRTWNTMVAKLVCLGSLALLIAFTPIASADAPGWCGMQNLNLVRNVGECVPVQPHTQAAGPQVVALPTIAVGGPGFVAEPSLVVAPLPGLVAVPTFVVKTPTAYAQFTCLPDGPVSPEACERMYALAQNGLLFTCSPDAGIPQAACDQVYAVMAKLAPGTQFTCIAQGPVFPAMCDELYAVSALLPFGFR